MDNIICTFELRRDLTELDTLCKKLENYGQSLGLSRKCMFEINLSIDRRQFTVVSRSLKPYSARH